MSLAIEYATKMLLWFAITFLLIIFIRKKKMGGKHNIFSIILFAYLVAICSVTLFPAVDFGIDSETCHPYFHFRFRDHDMSKLNLIPFKTIFSAFTKKNHDVAETDQFAVGCLNLAGNIFLFIPIGFLAPQSVQKRYHFGWIILFAVILSSGIEIIQYYIGRSADIDDVLLNTFGTAAGYGIWIIQNQLRFS